MAHGAAPKDDAPIGADAIAEFLVAHDIRTVFSLAGASFSYLLRVLGQRGVQVIPSRHESATVAAADGYARVTGKLGVAMIIADQGVPNAIGGLATAFYASSPVLVLAARLPLTWEEAEAEVDHDANRLVRPISKWARNVPAADRIVEYCMAAAKWATYGRPGPVVLSFVQDILAHPLAAPPVVQRLPPAPKAALSEPVVGSVHDLLAAARRPIVVVGSEATRDDAGPALRRLAAMGVPVLGNGLGRGLVPEDRVTGFAWPFAQLAAKEADLVLFLGARPTRRFGFGLPPRLGPHAKVVQIDSQAEFLHRNRLMTLAATADVGHATVQIADACAASGLRWSPEWLSQNLSARADAVDALVNRNVGPIHPLEVAATLDSLAPENAILIGDGGDIQNWAYGAQTVHTAPGFIENYPLGSMGIGMPLAVGAAAGAREMALGGAPRPVIVLTGDGSFGFYPTELQSASQAGLALTVVIANDAAWGTEMHGQRKVLGEDFNTRLAPSRYERIAHAFDQPGYYVEAREDLRPTIQTALADGGVSVVNVMIDSDAGLQLKQDPLVNMILFAEVTEGIAALRDATTQPFLSTTPT